MTGVIGDDGSTAILGGRRPAVERRHQARVERSNRHMF
jgi:hypothetical protein